MQSTYLDNPLLQFSSLDNLFAQMRMTNDPLAQAGTNAAICRHNHQEKNLGEPSSI